MRQAVHGIRGGSQRPSLGKDSSAGITSLRLSDASTFSNEPASEPSSEENIHFVHKAIHERLYAWEYPLSREEMKRRVMHLFENECGGLDVWCGDFLEEHERLKAENALLRLAQEKRHSLGSDSHAYSTMSTPRRFSPTRRPQRPSLGRDSDGGSPVRRFSPPRRFHAGSQRPSLGKDSACSPRRRFSEASSVGNEPASEPFLESQFTHTAFHDRLYAWEYPLSREEMKRRVIGLYQHECCGLDGLSGDFNGEFERLKVEIAQLRRAKESLVAQVFALMARNKAAESVILEMSTEQRGILLAAKEQVAKAKSKAIQSPRSNSRSKCAPVAPEGRECACAIC